MRKEKKNKSCIIGMILLVLGMNIIPITTSISVIQKSTLPILEGDTIYVGGSGSDNYSSIQAAIDNASSGDTVFVFNDSSPYFEKIIINKSINLKGEDRESTEIWGDYEGDVVNISADHVKITGFTIRYSGNWNAGIIIQSNFNVIEDNILLRNSDGIRIKSSHDNIISGNIIGSDEKDLYILENSNDNIIDNNTIRGGWAGIYVRFSSDRNIYSNNTVIYCYLGIGILDSSDSIIVSNTVKKSKYGIGIDNANNSIISDNIIADNEESGVGIYESIGNTVTNNTFENDGLFVKKSYFNTVSDNTVNDLPLVYLEDESQIIVPSSAGQVILVNCNKITIQNQILTNTSYAIELYNSEECNIKDNVLSNNTVDIYLGESNNNEVVNNSVDARDFYSVRLYYSNGNNISENKVNGILDTSAIFVEYSNANIISGNILSNHSIISILRSDGNSVIGNIMSTGSGFISLRIADNNEVIGNTIESTESGLGIRLDVSDNNIISGNTITNRVYGLIVEKSNGNTITRNDIKNNDEGVTLEESKNNKITKNNFIDNEEKHAYCTDSLINLWRRNFWERPRILPKLIPGKINIYRDWPMPPIVIPIPSIDLYPARTLNEIN
jgi:parallel beta-helix repeat protein